VHWCDFNRFIHIPTIKQAQPMSCDLWYDDLTALLGVIKEAVPSAAVIARSTKFLDVMDTAFLRWTMFAEAKNHHAGLEAIIQHRSLPVAKEYLNANGGPAAGSIVTKYYEAVVSCIDALSDDTKEECWRRMAKMNTYCSPVIVCA
jgi:hypothetical protein